LSIHHFARGIGAARSGDVDLARAELAAIRDLLSGVGQETNTYFREQMQVHNDAVLAWILLAEGKYDQALQAAQAAADREDAVDKHPVTPGEVIPARELYADMLFETDNHAAALKQYEIVLAGSPKRLNAMLGAAGAAMQTGDRTLAEQYYAEVREQTRSGNRQRASLDRAWHSTR
jgi:uncharacterized protein HemY